MEKENADPKEELLARIRRAAESCARKGELAPEIRAEIEAVCGKLDDNMK